MFSSKIKIHYYLFLLAFLVLAGCTTFGIPTDQWDKLNDSQKKIVMEKYYKEQEAENQRQAQQRAKDAAAQAEIDKIKAKNQPFTDALELVSNSLAQTHSHKKKKHQQCMTDNFGRNTVCGYNCIKDNFGNPHCADAPRKHCIAGSFNEVACGYNCYKDNFGHPHCADK